jgi:hypothetical protein
LMDAAQSRTDRRSVRREEVGIFLRVEGRIGQ